MMADQALLLSYIVFVLLQALHVFEEIAGDIFEIQIGHVRMARNRYLIAASVLSTLTIAPLALLIYDHPLGYYLGLLTSGVIGILQGVVHVAGFLRAGNTRRGLGAGVFTAIPLSITGGIVFVQLVQHLPQ